VYSFRIRARGETSQGEPFEREQTLSGVAVAGGDYWSPNDPVRDPLCELVECLRRQGSINDELRKRLLGLGLDLEVLLNCLGKQCGTPGDEGRGADRLQASLSTLSTRELLDAMADLLTRRERT
jgi:hypothetical protein